MDKLEKYQQIIDISVYYELQNCKLIEVKLNKKQVLCILLASMVALGYLLA